MQSNAPTWPPLQPWQITVCAVVGGYLALGVATHSIRAFHWFLLAVIPAALLASKHGRRFFIDWVPLFAFWLVYDRLRLLQPFLLNRVLVESPYVMERWAFGWMAGGEIPAHASRMWLAAHSAEPLWSAVSWSAQIIYLSHIFVLPLLLFFWWLRGRTREHDRERFRIHMRAFAVLHAFGILIYIILPVAPPWWVSLHGLAQPSAELVARTDMAAAMDGQIVRGLIRSASLWFGAVPSLHGAYPVLMFLLALRDRHRAMIMAFALYSAAMFITTVILNQHYIIDLLAGGAVAVLACHIWSAATCRSFRKR
ncbi:MAG: phosphatase PAP2 family protein [Blastocatellia bacterium]|nr:phosphatase PAP2 family protein [Blastocatellia bacterium]